LIKNHGLFSFDHANGHVPATKPFLAVDLLEVEILVQKFQVEQEEFWFPKVHHANGRVLQTKPFPVVRARVLLMLDSVFGELEVLANNLLFLEEETFEKIKTKVGIGK
jgi:hypothetical protein